MGSNNQVVKPTAGPVALTRIEQLLVNNPDWSCWFDEVRNEVHSIELDTHNALKGLQKALKNLADLTGEPFFTESAQSQIRKIFESPTFQAIQEGKSRSRVTPVTAENTSSFLMDIKDALEGRKPTTGDFEEIGLKSGPFPGTEKSDDNASIDTAWSFGSQDTAADGALEADRDCGSETGTIHLLNSATVHDQSHDPVDRRATKWPDYSRFQGSEITLADPLFISQQATTMTFAPSAELEQDQPDGSVVSTSSVWDILAGSCFGWRQ